MVIMKAYGDPSMYRDYYRNQAGYGAPPYFQGAPVMYGAGLGFFFRSLFRRAMPFLRRGYEIAKPHVKAAASNIAQDVVGSVTSAVVERMNKQPQEGAGLVYRARPSIKRKRRASRRRGPPMPYKKRKRSSKRAHKRRSVSRKRTSKKRATSNVNIF